MKKAMIVVVGLVLLGASVLSAQEPPAKVAPTQEAPAQETTEAPGQEALPQESPAPEAPAQEQLVQQPAVLQPTVQPAPIPQPTVYARVPRKAKLFVEGSETVDASNSKNKASYGDFTLAISAALLKKKVPVMVVTDPERADFLVRHTSSAKEDSTGTKIAKIAVLGGLWGSSKFEASIMVIDKASTGVVFSYNVKKGNFQSAAEAFAKHLNNHIDGKS